LIFQSRSWDHGVFLGSILSSETTAAATGTVGKLRRDPFAMLPFCGYNMADYFAHWLTFSERFDEAKLPKIFYVNWFRKGADGRWLWPGYGENSRVLEWVFERSAGRGDAVETPIGFVPSDTALNIEGLDVTVEDMTELLTVHHDEWRHEVPRIESTSPSSVTICPETPRRSQSPRSQAGVVRPRSRRTLVLDSSSDRERDV